MIRRMSAVEATIQKYDRRPLVLGRDDCIRMTAFCLRKLGVKTPLLKAGTYSSETGARRALTRMGYKTIPDAIDALGLPRIAPATALPGDVLGLKAEGGLDGDVALAIAVGNGRALGFWAEAGVCTVFQPMEYDLAWRAI